MAKKKPELVVLEEDIVDDNGVSSSSIESLKQRYISDSKTLAEQIATNQRQLNAFEGAIAACEEVLQLNNTT